MVKLYNKKALDAYLKDDFLLRELKKHPEDEVFASHKWLLDMPAKRMIYADVYGPFLRQKGRLKLLDVGGGFCSLSRELVKRHDYALLDIMAHENHKTMETLSRSNGDFWFNGDWYDFELFQKYDCVIANDIFPNVDQRLKLFINKFRPHSKKIIITLTCYNEDRYYTVKRLGADEVFTIVPWSRGITEMVLHESIPEQDARLPIPQQNSSLFQNGRIIYRLDI